MADSPDKSIPELDEARAGAPDSDFTGVAFDKVLQKTVKRPASSASVSSNAVRGGAKFVRYVSSAYLGVVAGDSTLDRLDAATLVVGNEAVVLNPSTTPASSSQQARGYVLAQVPAGTAGAVLALADAEAATTETRPCLWVERGTAAGDAATVEPFDPDRDVYANGSTVKYIILGALDLFSARKTLRASDFQPAKIPAPTGYKTDPNWTAAPSNSYSHKQNTDIGTSSRSFVVGAGDDPTTNYPSQLRRTVLGFGQSDEARDTPAAIAYRWQNDDGSPANAFEICYYWSGVEDNDTWQPIGGAVAFAALLGQPADNPALAAALAAKENTGVAAALDNLVLAALRGGVSSDGDNLQKLYNMLQLRAVQYNVATVAARNALNVKVGTWVSVDDDGDGRWAIYRATSNGVNASYNKVSDPDLLNAVMTAAQIRLAYLSNPGTQEFTTAYRGQLDTLIARGGRFIGPYAAGVSVLVNDLTFYSGALYYATAAHVTSGSFNSSGAWTNFNFGSGGGGSSGGVSAADLTTAKTRLPFTLLQGIQNNSYLLASSDIGQVLLLDSPTDVTVTVPAGLGTASNNQGEVITLRQIGQGRVLVAYAANVNHTEFPTGANKTAGRYASITLHCTAPDTWNLANAV